MGGKYAVNNFLKILDTKIDHFLSFLTRKKMQPLLS